MALARIIIQSSDDWIRVYLNDVVVIDNHCITSRDLKELFQGCGFGCIIQHGCFGGENGKEADEHGDYIFDLNHEER